MTMEELAASITESMERGAVTADRESANQALGRLLESQSVILRHMEGCAAAANMELAGAALITAEALSVLVGYFEGKP